MSKDKKSKFDRNFAEDPQLAERVAAYFAPRIKITRTNRLQLDEAMWRFYNMWNVTKDGYHSYTGRAQLYIPEVRKSIESQARYLTKTAFPGADCFDVTPGLTGSKRGAQAWRSIHTWGMKQAQVPLKYYVAMRQMCMLGTVPIYLPWRKDVRHEFRSRRDPKSRQILPVKQEVELFNGPDFVVRDIFRWYPFNPKKTDLSDGCFEIMACGPQEIKRLEREGVLANADRILAGGGNAYAEEEFARDVMRAESMGINIQYNQGYAGTAEIKKKDIDEQNSDKTYMRTVIFADVVFPEACEDDEDPEKPIPMLIEMFSSDVCSRIQRNPFFHQRPPYVIGRYIQPNADEFYGQGIPWAIQYMQYEMNSKAEQGMDSSTLALNPLAIVDPGLAGASNEFNVEPGAIWWANPQGVKLATMPDVSPIAQAAIQGLRGMMADYSDRSPALPTQLMGKSRTATQSEIVNDSLGVDTWLFQMANEGQILEPMLEQWEALADQNLEEGQLVMILGRRAGDLKRTLLSKSDILGRYSYAWKGASAAANDQIVARQMLDALKVYSTLPPQAQQQLNFNFQEFFKILWSDKWKLHDSDKILGEPEEMVTQDAKAENKMAEMGLELEVLPMDDDLGHMREHDSFLAGAKNQTVKTILMAHIIEHKKSKEQKDMLKQIQQQQQQQMMQMQMMLAQQGGKRGSQGSGNRTQLSPSASTGDMASGMRA